MAKKLGNDYRLWIESTVPGTYNEIKGQQSLSHSESAGLIDTSDKTNAPYGTSAPGLLDLTISLDGVADLPDASGFTRLETQKTAQAATKFQIRRGGSAGNATTDVAFEGACFITGFNRSYGQNAAVTYQATLKPATAPTTNALV